MTEMFENNWTTQEHTQDMCSNDLAPKLKQKEKT